MNGKSYSRISINVLKTAVFSPVGRKRVYIGSKMQELLTKSFLKTVCKVTKRSTDTRFHDREIPEHETPPRQRNSADCSGHPGQGSAAGPSSARL